MEIQYKEWFATFRLATEHDVGLVAYDHTKLSAINTCPTWGILRYSMHKRMPASGRALALEAGSAMHQVFAFVRLVSLCNQLDDQGKDKSFVDETWAYHGERLFGAERMHHLQSVVSEAEDVVDVAKRGAIGVLDTSGFYDDPTDRRRTLNNMEECSYAYINRWRWDQPVWMRDLSNPHSDVGIEIPFDLVCDVGNRRFKFVGRIDGIHWDGLGRLTVHDNKTASRLGDAWSMAQEVNHQYTGYCVAAHVFTQQVVERCDVLGLAIPLPKSYDFGGFAREGMQRNPHHFGRWLQWLVHSVDMCVAYTGDPYDAPKYTHSCNRYFRPCSFIPFCYADDEEQQSILSEMEHDEWSPLHKLVLDGVGNE